MSSGSHPAIALWLALVAFCSQTLLAAEDVNKTSQPGRPNILVIMADDLGYADLGVQGGCEIPTPHLDQLAASGIRCTNAYVSAPYCSPSRAGFLTGKYQTRFGHEFNPHVGEEAKLGLPLEEVTIANLLQKEGYRTALIGKWHQGFSKDHHPQSRGFDEFFGFLVGGHNYLLHKEVKARFGTAHSHDMIYRGREVEPQEGYATDLFTNEALRWMSATPEKPWFLYLAYNAVHTPLEIAPHLQKRIPESVKTPARRGYLSLLAGLDDSIGRITEHLTQNGLRDKTLIIFLSDNGGAGRSPFLAYNTGLNHPLRGDKGQTLEGGIRIPFFVSWPGQLPAGTIYEQPIISLDILPTVCQLASKDPAKPQPPPEGIDGVNLMPYWLGKRSGSPHESLFWRFGPQKAVRAGNWKLVDWRDFPASKNSGWELYDLSTDISEKNNLAETHPETVARLKTSWEKWNQSNIEPLWRGSKTEDPFTATK